MYNIHRPYMEKNLKEERKTTFCVAPTGRGEAMTVKHFTHL